MKLSRTTPILVLPVLLLFILTISSRATDVAATEDEYDLTIAIKPDIYSFSIYVRDVKRAFSDLVALYEKKTGKAVSVTFYSSDDDLNEKMNVELLSGGPDLITGTAIPYWSLARRGALTDIAELIENDPDVNMDDFFANIIDPFKDEEGRLYIMPLSYSFFLSLSTIPSQIKWSLKHLMNGRCKTSLRVACSSPKRRIYRTIHIQ